MTFRQATVQELRDTFPWASEDFIQNNASDGAVDTAKSPTMPVQPIKKRSKYNAIPTTYNGVVYHSKKEATFAQKLDLMLKDHEINYVLRQVPFDLGAGITYRADFVTLAQKAIQLQPDTIIPTPLWFVTIYEVKGMETPAWKLKHKLFKGKYPLINLVIV